MQPLQAEDQVQAAVARPGWPIVVLGVDEGPLSALAALCDASLVHREPGSASRFRLADTVRWLAGRALADSGASHAVQARLLTLLVQTAKEAERAFWWLPDRQCPVHHQHLPSTGSAPSTVPANRAWPTPQPCWAKRCCISTSSPGGGSVRCFSAPSGP